MSNPLDTVSTTGSVKTKKPLGSLPSSGASPRPHQHQPEKFGKLAFKRSQNKLQVKSLLQEAKEASLESRFRLLKAATSLEFCNKMMLLKKTATESKILGVWNCGKKYCAICAGKKRNKLLFRYLTFFESQEGTDLLQKYDIALFTVTLRHNTLLKIRTEPYYKELSTHWRNAIKYGAFKKYFAGGFYNTEHTYGDDGHHIHRHAMVMIPKEFELEKNYKQMEEDLRSQWLSRTGDSFQIDLTPFYKEKILQDGTKKELTLKDNLLETTKYITKRGKGNVINGKIIEAVDTHSREKFYNKFGILYKIKALNMNQVNEEQNAEAEVEAPKKQEVLFKELMASKDPFQLVLCTGLNSKRKKVVDPKTGRSKKIPDYYYFSEENQFTLSPTFLESFRYQTTLAWWNWYLKQTDRYEKKFFYEEWKSAKDFKKRFDERAEAVKIKEAVIKKAQGTQAAVDFGFL